MSLVADYVALLDNRIMLPNANDGINREFTFDLPGDPGPSDPGLNRGGILSYVVRANSPGQTYTITLNGVEVVRDATQIDAERRTVHELVRTADLRRSGNTLVVERTSGSGTIEFGGIVLWFQRDI